jgi:hypothetical protein
LPDVGCDLGPRSEGRGLVLISARSTDLADLSPAPYATSEMSPLAPPGDASQVSWQVLSAYIGAFSGMRMSASRSVQVPK